MPEQDVPFPDILAANIFAPLSEDNPYLLYELEADWKWQSGVSQQPVAATGADAEMIQVSGAYGQLVVRFAIIREGDWPEMPTSRPGDSNRVLLRGNVRLVGPKPSGSGKIAFGAKGELVFGLKQPVTDATGFPGLRTPVVAMPKEGFGLYSSFFTDALI